MKVQTEYGEQDLEEVVRCFHLWKKLLADHNERRHQYNQTEQGKKKNRDRAKQYYERKKEEILQRKRDKYQAEKEQPQFVD